MINAFNGSYMFSVLIFMYAFLTARYYSGNLEHWIAYLSSQLNERYDTPWRVSQTVKVSEGIFMSSGQGREATAYEIEEMSVSSAIRTQETEWDIQLRILKRVNRLIKIHKNMLLFAFNQNRIKKKEGGG